MVMVEASHISISTIFVMVIFTGINELNVTHQQYEKVTCCVHAWFATTANFFSFSGSFFTYLRQFTWNFTACLHFSINICERNWFQGRMFVDFVEFTQIEISPARQTHGTGQTLVNTRNKGPVRTVVSMLVSTNQIPESILIWVLFLL